MSENTSVESSPAVEQNDQNTPENEIEAANSKNDELNKKCMNLVFKIGEKKFCLIFLFLS